MGSVARTVADAIRLAAGNGNLQAYLNGYRIGDNSYFSFHACTVWDVSSGLSPHGGELPAAYPPEIDWTAWDGAQTLVELLNSQDSGGGWSSTYAIYPAQGYAARVANTANGAPGFWLCEVAPWMLPYVSGRALTTSTATPHAPVWPGIDFVTLGTPVALAPGLTVDGPMHGLILDLTTIPPDYQHIAFDTEASWYHIGQVAFATDNGYIEGFQPFSFESQILVPRRMVWSSACYLRGALGVEGTATPWTITAEPIS